jgi:hypothetical protein
MQLYRYFVSQSSEFCRRNLLCCFSKSVVVVVVVVLIWLSTQSGKFWIYLRILIFYNTVKRLHAKTIFYCIFSPLLQKPPTYATLIKTASQTKGTWLTESIPSANGVIYDYYTDVLTCINAVVSLTYDHRWLPNITRLRAYHG